MVGGPVGGEVGEPVGTEIPTPAGLKRLQGEMNAPLTESPLVQGVGVLNNMHATWKKDEHGTHFESGSGWSSTEHPVPSLRALSCISVDESALVGTVGWRLRSVLAMGAEAILEALDVQRSWAVTVGTSSETIL